MRQYHQLPLTGTPSFTPAETKEAIRLAKSSTAIGPDGVSTRLLKKLAHGAINYQTKIFNPSISTGQIPEIWHKAIVFPFLKPGKDSSNDKNWRHISLLCSASKTLVKLLVSKMLTQSTSTMHNMAFGRNTRYAVHCQQSSSTLLPASQEKSRLTVQFSSRSI